MGHVRTGHRAHDGRWEKHRGASPGGPGEACADYADRTIRGVRPQAIQLDEIWSFCYAKHKNAAEKKGVFGYGDVWTWVALDADTKLVFSWLVGRRDARHAEAFVSDVASRVEGSPQITTDGLQLYRWAVAGAFEVASTTRRFRRSTARRRSRRDATALRSASAATRSSSLAIPTRRRSARATSSTICSRCAWECVA